MRRLRSGYASAVVKADKFEARLIAARAHKETACNRYAATIESTNDKEGGSKVNDNKFRKRKLKEPDEWKDHKGKTH
jgi:hypothetical protein